MSNLTAALLIEIGCEELPAGPLPGMASAFQDGLFQLLMDNGFVDNSSAKFRFFTPRRLAVRIENVRDRSPDKTSMRQGPSVEAAFKPDGEPTPAALGFAKSVNADIADLKKVDTPKGQRLAYEVTEPGQSLTAVLQEHLPDIIKKLPMPKTMRWSDTEFRFLRPVQWLLGLHGESVLDIELFGLNAGKETYGHRIHAAGGEPIEIPKADGRVYEGALERHYVEVDESNRKKKIRNQLRELALSLSLQPWATQNDDDPDLIQEVANLTEWPVGVACEFPQDYLEIPAEAVSLSMKTHQKFFPLYQNSGDLSHHFVAFANVESTDPAQVKGGFERVIRPRLADAKFFWDQDRKQPLAEYFQRLENVTFQQDLGSLADKTRRTQQLAARIAEKLGIDNVNVMRAVELSLCDLMTEMVGEFPELQGVMGRYYALESGEDNHVAAAIEEHYQPIGSGQPIAGSQTGRLLAIAERVDRLLGIFAAGKKPTGNKDPFALRRAALGLIRTLIEGELDLPLDWLLAQSAEILNNQITVSEETRAEVLQFIYDRLEGYLPVKVQTFRAVYANRVTNLLDFAARANAVEGFSQRPEAASLAAANKRASNLLRQNPLPDSITIKDDLLDIDAEADLLKEIGNQSNDVEAAMAKRDYAAALTGLASLQTPVDQFFDDVMVMVDDEELRNNRLALLARLQALCTQVADIAELDV